MVLVSEVILAVLRLELGKGHESLGLGFQMLSEIDRIRLF